MQSSVIIPLNTGNPAGVVTKQLPALGDRHPVRFIPVTADACDDEPKTYCVASVGADLLRCALTCDRAGLVEVEISSWRDQGMGPRLEVREAAGRSASKW